MNQDEQEMAQWQNMLNQDSTTAAREKAGQLAKFKSHADEIKEKFNAELKTPLEGLSGPLLFENLKGIIAKSTNKVLGSAVDEDTTKAISNLVENKDIKGFTNHIVNKLTKKHNLEDVMAEPADGNDAEGFGSMIKNKLSSVLSDFKQNVQNKLKSVGQSLKDGAENLKSKITGEIPRLNMGSEINHISPYQDPFSTGLDSDLVEMATKGDLAGAKATLAFRQSLSSEGGTADSFLNKMRNARSLASDGLTNNQSSFKIGDAIRREQAKITSRTQDIKSDVQQGIDDAKSKVDQLNRTDTNAPIEPTDTNAPVPTDTNAPVEPNKPTFNPSEDQKGLSNIEDIAGAHADMEEGETRKIGSKLFKKIGAEMLETDAASGGPEDIFGDVAGAVVGLGTLFAGIFAHKKRIVPPPMPTLRSTVQFGV